MVTELKYGFSLAILLSFFTGCLGSTPTENFIIDNIQAYLFFPAKTTVGYAPKFTTNRKFFANLIGTPQFHHMMNNDLVDLKKSFIDKLRFCDESVMDETMLKDLYDKEFMDNGNAKK